MEQYIINIPNEKATSYKLVTFIIAIINLTAFVYLFLQGHQNILAIVGAIISLLCLLLLFSRQNRPAAVTPEGAFAALSMLWIATGNILPGILMLIFSLLGFYTNRKAVIRFTTEGIYYPSMPVKFLPWEMVDFAMMKEGILTIELKDNRVFQFTLSQQVEASIEDKKFNRFCIDQKLKAASP